MSKNEISEIGQMVNALHSQMLDPMLDELSEMGYDIEISLMWDEDKQQGSIGFFSDTPSEEEKKVVMELYQKYLAIAEYL